MTEKLYPRVHPETAILQGDVEEARRFFEGKGDEEVFQEIQKLREECESPEGWARIKKDAIQEIDKLPSDFIERLISKAKPFIEALPAGHGRGHFYRDTVNLSIILQDPDLKGKDPVELTAGVVGGLFHDIGNSVVDRYQDPFRAAGHAETGAYLVGILGKGIIPPNLLKLSMLGIAAHTQYTKDRVVEKSGKTFTTKPYDDEMVDGNKLALWIPRWTDRLDANGPIMAIRHIITKAEPTVDFSGGEFQPVWKSEEDDFRHQFKPELRSNEARQKLPKPQSGTGVLEHLVMFADSNFNPKLPYAKYDSRFYRYELIMPFVVWQRQFVLAALSTPPEFSQGEMNQHIDKFLELCEVVEPAKESGEVTGTLKRKFEYLSEEERRKWAFSFMILSDLYGKWYGRVDEMLKGIPDFDDISVQNMAQRLRHLGISTLHEFSPYKNVS